MKKRSEREAIPVVKVYGKFGVAESGKRKYPFSAYAAPDWAREPMAFYTRLSDMLDMRLAFGCDLFSLAEMQHAINHLGAVWHTSDYYLNSRPVN